MEAARGPKARPVPSVSDHLFSVAARNASNSSEQQVRNWLHSYNDMLVNVTDLTSLLLRPTNGLWHFLHCPAPYFRD